MRRAQSVVEFYVLCNKLKEVIRSGWKTWNVDVERRESVAEHVYGTQMLAIAMWSQYDYDLDMQKVLTMLAVHELEETVIGDLTLFDIDEKSKLEMGHNAVKNILSNMKQGEELEKLIYEFDAKKTPEAIFAFFCDKLECDLQCCIYDKKGGVNLDNQPNNNAIEHITIRSLLESGKSWSEMWLLFSQGKYDYDEHFKAVSDYAKDHFITKGDIQSLNNTTDTNPDDDSVAG